MKKISLIFCSLLLILLFSSCGNKQIPNNSAKRYVDSINAAKDSIKAVKFKENSFIAWGDTKFGMSRQEVKSSITFRGGDFKEKLFFVSQDSTTIGGIKFSTIYADFYKNALYKIVIQSNSKSTNDFDDLLRIVETLRSKIQYKYGQPSFTEKDTEYVGSRLMDKKSVTLFKWEIDKKHINISFMHDFDNYFYVEGLIYDSELANKELNQNKPHKQIDAGGF